MIAGLRAARLQCVWPVGRIAVVSLVVSLLVLGSRASAAGVEEYVGKLVLEVRLVSNGGLVQDQALLDLVETKVGAPLSIRQVRESLLHLFTLGRFQDVQVDAASLQQGVALHYDLIPLQVVERLEFRGLLGLTRNQLREAIAERYGQNPRVDLADEAVRALTNLYRDHGYLNARVATEVERDTMVFKINAGPRVRIGTIELRGAPLQPPAQLLARLNLREGGIYDRDAIERRLADYEDELRSRRHYEAELDHTIAVRGDRRNVDVTLRVEPGPRVTVVFDGDPLLARDRAELVPIAREGSVDEDLLEDTSRRIEAYLLAQGYWKAQVSHNRKAVGDELSIVFGVQRGARYTIADVEIIGNTAVTLVELKSLLRVSPGDPFVEAEFDANVAEIVEYYRRLGHAQVHVQPTVTEVSRPEAAAARVTPQLVIDEGVPTTIGSITFGGSTDPANADLWAVVQARPGQPYYGPQIREDRDAVRLLYLNDGYETTSVNVDVQPSTDRRTVDLVFTIREGPQVIVDHILIVGNRQIKASTIRREIVLQEGGPLGLAAVFETRRRLTALGLFRRIDIREFSHGGGDRRDVVIVVDEAPATSIAYGAGLEVGQRLRRGSETGGQAVERLEFAPRGFFQIGRRNLWGKNRSIDLFTRVSFRPSDDPQDLQSGGGGFRFNEYRVLGTYREPRAFGFNADVLVTGFIEQAIRSSFNLFRRGVNAEVRRAIRRTVSIGVGYTFDQNKLSEERFNPADKLLIDRLFPEVVLSTFSGALVRDTRDDPFEPTGGTLLGLDTEIAGRRIGSEVGFAKAFLQGFVYRPWPGSRRIIIAAGARLGLARGFLRDVEVVDEAGNPVLRPDGEPITVRVADLPASKRFFAGGDTTVRGFVLDRLGDDASHAAPGTERTIDQDGFPHGGNAIVVFNGEIRLPVWRDLGAVAFLDAGNVFDRVDSLDLRRIRGTAGFGIRYRSPIGPVRVDLGFKLDRRRFASGEQERLTALHVSIGQAF